MVSRGCRCIRSISRLCPHVGFRLVTTEFAALVAFLFVACDPSPTAIWDEDFWGGATVEDMQTALQEGLSLDSRDEFGDTPLHYAAEFNEDPLLVSLLLDRGADIGARGFRDETPLHRAAGDNGAPVVSLLLDRGADASERDSLGNTPLHMATNNDDLIVAQLLLERGADVRATNNSNATPLHWETLDSGRPEMIELLLDWGADPAATSNLGRMACTGLDIETLSAFELQPGLCAATPVPVSPSVARREAEETRLCSKDVGQAVMTFEAEALHDYASDRHGIGPIDGSLQQRWLCIPEAVVREIAPVNKGDHVREVELSMEKVIVPGSQGTHVVRVTTYHPEKTGRVLRTTGILCVTDDVGTLRTGEKITVFGRYNKSRTYLDLANDDSDIQTQFVRFCQWERER